MMHHSTLRSEVPIPTKNEYYRISMFRSIEVSLSVSYEK